MIKVRIFDDRPANLACECFLEKNNITREQIISISLGVDPKASERFVKTSMDRILLVYEE